MLVAMSWSAWHTQRDTRSLYLNHTAHGQARAAFVLLLHLIFIIVQDSFSSAFVRVSTHLRVAREK